VIGARGWIGSSKEHAMANINGKKVALEEITNASLLGELLRSSSADGDGWDLCVELMAYEHDRLEIDARTKGMNVRQYLCDKLNEALIRAGKEEIPLRDCFYTNHNPGYAFVTLQKEAP